MDIATIIGLITGIALILWAILTSSPLSSFLDAPSAAIVFGGALAAALISFPIQNLLAVAKVVRNCFFARARDPKELISEMVRYAEVARRDGILALENVTSA
jgi:chemotaxis protein MotA